MTPGTLEPLPTVAAPGTVASPASPATEESGFSDLLRMLRKRKWVILACLVLGFAYGWYKNRTQVRVYVASGTIEVGTGSSSAFRVGGAGTGGFEQPSRIATEVAILKSDSLLLAVGRDLDLANNPHFMGGSGAHLSIDDLAVRQAVIGTLSGDIMVTVIPKTNLVRISCSTLDPKLSADIVNKLVIEYIHRSLQSRADATRRAADFLTPQIDELKKQLEDAQERMIDIGKTLGIIGLDANAAQATNNLPVLTGALGQAEIRRILNQSRFHILQSTEPNSVDTSIDPAAGAAASTGPSQLAQLRGEREAAETQYAELAANLGPRMPQVRAVRARIDALNKAIAEEQTRILTQARQNVAAARTDEASLQAALDTEKAEAYKRRDEVIAYSFRQREYESLQRLYDSLRERLRTASVQAGLESTEIEIVDRASPPLAPSLQPRSTILLMNTVMAGVIGIVLAFLIDALDTGIQSITEVETITGFPSLTLVPRTRRTTDAAGQSVAERNLGVLSGPKSQFAEAFRALRTSLLLSTPGVQPKVVLLTSSTPSEGKTTVALNLAAVLSQRDVRVLLIDADLRRPAVHHRLGLSARVGLTSVLSGNIGFQEALQQIPALPNLDVLVSGPVPPFPAEMLGSAAMQTLVENARGVYTHIVIDSPPVLSVSDSVVLSHDVDAVLMVVRYGKSSKHAVRRARDLLVRSGVKTIGIVLNAVESNSPEYYSYYGYGGYSAYGSAGADGSAWDAQSRKTPPSEGDRR